MNYEFIGLFGLECLMAIIIDYFVAKKIKKREKYCAVAYIIYSGSWFKCKCILWNFELRT